MNRFYQYHIKVDDVVVGDLLSKNIKAARFQHAKYIFRSSQTALFVIERVTDPSWEEFLDTPYNLVEFSQLQAEHCLQYPVNRYIDYLGNSDACIQTGLEQVNGNLIANNLRSDLFNEVVEHVEIELMNRKVFLSLNSDYMSDGVNILDTEDQKERCYDADLDKYTKNPDCDFSDHYSVLSYEVTKSQGEGAMMYFRQQLKATRLNLEPFDVRYRIIEHNEFSEFQVHYKY